MHEVSKPCGDEAATMSRGHLGCQAAAAPSDSSWHPRPALKPIDTESLPLAFISFGSRPWHVVCASLFIMSCISSSLPGKIRQLIFLLKEVI